MQEFKKTKIVLYINIIFSFIFIFASVISFSKTNETTVHLGMDLYLIFAFVLLIFAFPSIYTLIRYLIQPNITLTINKDEFIIHKRNRKIRFHASRLLGVSKYNNNLNEIIGLDIGTLKILLLDEEKPIFIRYITELDKAYQTLNVLIIRYFEYFNKK